MTDDLVRRLRGYPGKRGMEKLPHVTMDEAADYIEKLEAANLKQSCIMVDDQMRIEKLEAALRSVLRYQLTDETWGMLGFDPKTIRAEFDAARNALEGKDD